ncbi:MAG: methyltransferase domain-containing protein [Candidatus Omnitrophica bacterium]|nr:methyltransferase domain-containing protein [Candidatus Omnitrophota bacterium]
MDLPQFPLTGIYVDRPRPECYPVFDQMLALCEDCGHAQLSNVIDPEYLYVQTYSHRSSRSAIARQGNDFFYSFLKGFLARRTFHTVAEIGCNDLYLLKKIQTKAKRLVGIDPIWKDRPLKEGKIRVLGKFADEVDLKNEMGDRPDLVISAHTFEHMADPRKVLEAWVKYASDRALFVIEVPAFETLLAASRFDQVFHQHLQYFSVASFCRLIEAVGGRYVAHTFNHQYWNGTLLIAFEKGKSGSGGVFPPNSPVPSAAQVRHRHDLFKQRMEQTVDFVQNVGGPLYGYGGAQMVPTLAYHLKSDLGFLECILDDDPGRDGLCYPALAVKIRKPWPGILWGSANILITALDSARPIMRRLLGLGPKSVFLPAGVW